jgi:hypothetical protein
MAAAGAEIKLACNGTLARATRRGILVTLLFFGWASVHYLFASVGIAKSLQSATLRNGGGLRAAGDP